MQNAKILIIILRDCLHASKNNVLFSKSMLFYCTDHRSQRSDDEDDEEEEGEVEEEEAAVKKGSDEEDSEREAEQKEEKTDGSQVVFIQSKRCSPDRLCGPSAVTIVSARWTTCRPLRGSLCWETSCDPPSNPSRETNSSCALPHKVFLSFFHFSLSNWTVL